eukprot:tig00000478_g1268.t1
MAAFTLNGIVNHLKFKENYSGENGLSTHRVLKAEGSVREFEAIGNVKILKPLASVLSFVDVGKIVEIERQYGTIQPHTERYAVFGIGDWWRLGMRQQRLEGLVGLGSNLSTAQQMAGTIANTLETINTIAPMDEITDGPVLNFISNQLLGALVDKTLSELSYDLTFGISDSEKFFILQVKL